MTLQESIMQKIVTERNRQDKLWGVQDHTPENWIVILTEEVGEVAKAVWHRKHDNYKEELIQIAAVAVAAYESAERNKLNEW